MVLYKSDWGAIKISIAFETPKSFWESVKGFIAEEKQGLGNVFSGCIINSNATVIIIDGVLSYYDISQKYFVFLFSNGGKIITDFL